MQDVDVTNAVTAPLTCLQCGAQFGMRGVDGVSMHPIIHHLPAGL